MPIPLLLALAASAVGGPEPSQAGSAPPLAVVVMDPLARPLSCTCVLGYGQRNYDRLGRHLEAKLGRRVRVRYAEALSKALLVLPEGKAHVIIGPRSVVAADAAEAGISISPLAMLSDKEGKTTHTGLVAVAADDDARRIGDLKGYRVIFGPPAQEERHGAAIAALRAAGIEVPDPVATKSGSGDAALAMLESDAKPGAAALIGSHEMPLLVGCEVLEEGEVRVVGETAPVPFIAAFATGEIDEKTAAAIRAALLSMREDADLLRAMESKQGFVPAEAARRGSEAAEDWPGWRGPRRDGIAPWLPGKLPETPRVIWRRVLEGPALAGVAATGTHVVVADRDANDLEDIFRCLRAETGEEVWSIRYPAPGNLDFGNTPRATPLVVDGMAYLLGAFGDLHCVDLAAGGVVWKMNIAAAFGAKLPRWGVSASPLAIGDKLIVNPGGRDASIVALDRRSGAVLWKAAGAA
ncbi:MAG: PhnD/SsuA/transferrin family substrate-binding protein, partial [Planctomycetes bacterium]|nr:PhnD/SsuA/transferrin family substrate-binding protein [Planctomycetota bacterium]